MQHDEYRALPVGGSTDWRKPQAQRIALTCSQHAHSSVAVPPLTCRVAAELSSETQPHERVWLLVQAPSETHTSQHTSLHKAEQHVGCSPEPVWRRTRPWCCWENSATTGRNPTTNTAQRRPGTSGRSSRNVLLSDRDSVRWKDERVISATRDECWSQMSHCSTDSLSAAFSSPSAQMTVNSFCIQMSKKPKPSCRIFHHRRRGEKKKCSGAGFILSRAVYQHSGIIGNMSDDSPS